MAGLSAGGGGAFTYIQATEPADPQKGESWYDTDGGTDGNGEAKVYDGTEWDVTGYISHDQLNNISPADHHDPVTVGAPLARSGQALALGYTDPFMVDVNDDLALSIANALTLDANNDLAVDESAIGLSNLGGYPIGTADLDFDTATQTELNNHAGDASAHHTAPTETQAANYSTSTAFIAEYNGDNSTNTVDFPVGEITTGVKFTLLASGFNSSSYDIYVRDPAGNTLASDTFSGSSDYTNTLTFSRIKAEDVRVVNNSNSFVPDLRVSVQIQQDHIHQLQ